LLKSKIHISQNGELLAKSFTEHFVSLANDAISKRGRFFAVLSGGGTPLMAYRLLAKIPLREVVPWEQVHLFWGDERHVPHEDPQSNFGQAREALLDHVNIPDENIHSIPTYFSPGEAAQAYAQTLRSIAEANQSSVRFDLVMLGLGSDGHTASLFPGQSALWNDLVIVTEGSYQGRPATRLTMTPLAFNQARKVVFLVSGEAKADALANALGETRDADRFPSQAIDPTNGKVLWMVDSAAAKMIPRVF